MRPNNPFTLAVLFSVIALHVTAQTTAPVSSPSPAPPSPGLLNSYLREQWPALSDWNIGGQVRGRFESRSGGAVAGAGPLAVDFSDHTPDNSYWLFREKIHIGYTPCPWFSVYGEGRDSSTLEDRRRPEPEEDVFDLHQAYITLGNSKEFPLTFKVGRQELSYGDERLVGAFDWNNIGRVFDAGKIRFENEAFWVDAFAGRVVLADDGQFNVPNDYDWFSGLYFSTRKLLPKLETQLYFLARNTDEESPVATTGSPQAGGPAERDIYTGGLRAAALPGQFGAWDFETELAGQFGNFRDVRLGRNLDQEAFAAHVGGGYTFQEIGMKPRIGLEYNFATGDHDPEDGKHGTFENLFPTNHKFYGYMDFFSWQNMHNPRVTASVKPLKGLTLSTDYHLFWLADTSDFFYAVNGAPRTAGGYGIHSRYDSFVGSELDLVANYSVTSWANFQVGYGHFFRGNYVKQSLDATGSKDADWVYVQALVNF